MVIQCEICRTVYKIDKSLIKKTGSKVRCSHCNHEFMAFPEETGDAALPEFFKTTQKESGSSNTSIGANKADKISEPHEKHTQDVLSELQSDLESIFEEVFKNSETQNASGDVGESAEEVSNALKDIIFVKDGSASHPMELSSPFDVLEKNGKSKAKEKKDKSENFDEQKAAGKNLRGIRVFLIIVVGLLLGGFLAWSSGLLPGSILGLFQDTETAKPEKTGVSLLKIGPLKSSFINSRKNGPLFVIEGSVTNNFLMSRNRILVKGSILDSRGNVIMAQNVYAGRTFSKEELNDVPLKEIRNVSKNLSGISQHDTEVLPGASIRFMIVFVGPPENMSRFKVNVVRSSAENK